MISGLPEQRKTDQPRCVLIFVPGTMQSVFDQSIGLITKQIAMACSEMTGRAFKSGNVKELHFASGRTVQRSSVVDTRDYRNEIVIISVNYTKTLQDRLNQASVLVRFLRLLVFWFGVMPLLCRIVTKPLPADHPQLSRANKGFLISAYVLVLVALVTAAVAVVNALGSPPHWLVLLTIAVAALVPGKVASAILATGNEYYGVVRYLLKSDQAGIHEYFADVLADIRDCYPDVPIHMLCFSFGCVVAFDHLFTRASGSGLELTLSSLSFIGFPHRLINSGDPDYFSRRKWLVGGIERWRNLYLKGDVLGSKVSEYLDEMFGTFRSTAIPLEDIRVLAQRQITSWANPITRHMAYWDPKASKASDAIQKITQLLIAQSAAEQPSSKQDVAEPNFHSVE